MNFRIYLLLKGTKVIIFCVYLPWPLVCCLQSSPCNKFNKIMFWFSIPSYHSCWFCRHYVYFCLTCCVVICVHYTKILCNVQFTVYIDFIEIMSYGFCTISFCTGWFYRENVDVLQRFIPIKCLHFTDIMCTFVWHYV